MFSLDFIFISLTLIILLAVSIKIGSPRVAIPLILIYFFLILKNLLNFNGEENPTLVSEQNLYSNQSPYNGANTNISYIPNFSAGTTSPESQQGNLYLFNFSNSSEYSFATLELVGATETPEYYGVVGGFCLTVAQATDGVQFYTTSGTITGGNFKLYGLSI